MAMLRRSKRILNLYLNDVYNREILFKISEEECESIRKGVELFVKRIITRIAKDEPKFEATLSRKNLLRVGSFYEGTKIVYPDEFDFLVILRKLTPEEVSDINEEESRTVHECLKNYAWYIERTIAYLKEEKMTTIKIDTGVLKIFNSNDKSERQGPATKIKLHYIKTGGVAKNIEVDITPALMVKGCPDRILQSTTKMAPVARECGTYLIIFNYDLDLPVVETFTNAEMKFVRKVLSDEHKIVFKLLKYLINGKHTTEQDKKHIFSSYIIKTMVFQHHFECQTPCETSQCVLDILESMLTAIQQSLSLVANHALKRPINVWYNSFTGRSFSKKIGREVIQYKVCLEKLLTNLKTDLGRHESCMVKPLIEYF